MTNGKRAFVEGNGASPWARRQRDLAEMYMTDLGPLESLSEAEISMCRRAATLACETEQMDGRLSMGEPVDLDLYSRISGHLRRIHESLGLKRAKRDITLNPVADHFSRPPERTAQP